MVRLLGKTAIEMKDDFQVALLVLASLALESEPESEPVREPTFAEAVRAISRNDGLSRVVDGITRLCEPFQQALARMPLDKLAPENAAQARQRLSDVVEEELGRIGRIRARLQKIADADEAEAPVRLAFETGTEGDRQRRYVLSYERLVNRRIDTFLKVRKASGSGELDLIELQQSMGADKLRELIVDAGIMTSPDPGDLRSGDGRGLETRAQHEETVGQPPASVNGLGSKGSARVFDPAATPDRRSPGSGLPSTSTPVAVRSDANGKLPSVSLVSESVCDDESILRNEATDEPDDLGGWGRHPQGDAPAAEAAAPGARWTGLLDPSHPLSEASQCDDFAHMPRNAPTAALEDLRKSENESPAGLAARADCDGKVKLDEPRSESGPNDIRVPLAAAEFDMPDDPVQVPSTESLAPAVASSAAVATAVPRPRLALTPEQELHNQRVRRYRAMKGLSPL
jgi:hypothetical protein